VEAREPPGDQLFDLEGQFWTAGSEFFRQNVAPAADMVYPDPAGVLVSGEIERSLRGRPRWSQVALDERRVLELGERAAVVTYKATARRAPIEAPYVARASSAYVHDGTAWKLIFHQQTPLAVP